MRNKNDFAPRAPMGWNSYDYYDTTVNEAQVRANADYLAAYLKDAGYEYVVIDIEWYANDAGKRRQEYQYIPFGHNEIDAYGRYQPSPERFPSSAGGKGFGPLAEYVHSLGLKFGIHIMRGIPRQAAHDRLPVQGTEYTCDQVADAWSICGWNPDNYGVRDTAVGQAYYDSVIRMYADWGVDFIKCDDICDTWMYPDGHRITFSGWHETRMLHRAIMRCGRDIVLSLSPGPAHVDRAWEYAAQANMWRITDDFWDNWELLKPMFWRCETWADRVERGCYPDCDMLPFGKLGAGFGEERDTQFSKDEMRTVMSLWAMFGSPLMIGAELTKLDDWTLQLLTKREITGLLDGAHHGKQLRRDEEEAVWINYGENGREVTVALFNLSESQREISVELAAGADILPEELQWLSGADGFTDVWEGGRTEAVEGCLSATVPAHGVKVYQTVMK